MQDEIKEAVRDVVGILDDLSKEIRHRAAARVVAGDDGTASRLMELARRVEQFSDSIRGWKPAQQKDSINPHCPTKAMKGKLPRGVRTPDKAFYLPILQALVQLGGAAPVRNVLSVVGEQMKDQLRDVDWQPLQKDPKTPRWENTAMWARYNLIKQGLLRNDSPRGMWEITEAGRRYLEEHSQ